MVDTIKTVFHYYFLTDSVRSCITETINAGGDADTVGALAGMLTGATYGAQSIPQSWLQRLDAAVAEQIRWQVEQLLMIAESNRPSSQDNETSGKGTDGLLVIATPESVEGRGKQSGMWIATALRAS